MFQQAERNLVLFGCGAALTEQDHAVFKIFIPDRGHKFQLDCRAVATRHHKEPPLVGGSFVLRLYQTQQRFLTGRAQALRRGGIPAEA